MKFTAFPTLGLPTKLNNNMAAVTRTENVINPDGPIM
jgi:hypothetical protein